MVTRDDYGAWVLALRRGRGWTQKQLGQALKLDRSTLSRWEHQRDWPDLRELVRYWRNVDGDTAIEAAIAAGYSRQQAVLEMDALLAREARARDPVEEVVHLLEGPGWHPEVGRALAVLVRITQGLTPPTAELRA